MIAHMLRIKAIAQRFSEYSRVNADKSDQAIFPFAQIYRE